MDRFNSPNTAIYPYYIQRAFKMAMDQKRKRQIKLEYLKNAANIDPPSPQETIKTKSTYISQTTNTHQPQTPKSEHPTKYNISKQKLLPNSKTSKTLLNLTSNFVVLHSPNPIVSSQNRPNFLQPKVLVTENRSQELFNHPSAYVPTETKVPAARRRRKNRFPWNQLYQ